MIKQSQIRNFISLIARKNAKATNPSATIKTHLQKQQSSSSRRYETEPIHIQSQTSQRNDWLACKRQTMCGQELVTQNYIKLSLYQKYRNSLNEKRNKTLKTEGMTHNDSQQELKANEVVFPVKRPGQKTVVKSKSLIKRRILSTPSHLMHLYPVQSDRASRQKLSKLPQLPFLQPQQPNLRLDQKQQNFHKPIFRVKKYQPLNYQPKIDQAYNLFSETTKPEQQGKTKSKPRIQKWIKWSRRGRKGDRDEGDVRELLQQSICGWVVEKGKSRCDYDV